MNIEEYYIVTLIASILVAAGLAFIPASIAKSKGYSFGLWWFYGWMIWIAAIIHVSCIRDKNAQQIPIYQNNTITSSIASSDYGKVQQTNF